MIPSRDALFLEGPDSPYTNIVAAYENNQNDPRFKQLVDALHSNQVRQVRQTAKQISWKWRNSSMEVGISSSLFQILV
ncbi:MetQ/NlpA family ABC transporter substrate-binding protein [Candidatus Coxiella mudrowiae]|uniref:MetQ/NlpA family ABC transporter substrate-binding protein n=1 Tax=Candidatus Coxiella mudrowiae TaxID=2054173 RepID=UPI0027D32D1F|nr:MetQ/NlpA family ABC transporter substrate-binding protein [Candidatus Coxiella mudrowiae]